MTFALDNVPSVRRAARVPVLACALLVLAASPAPAAEGHKKTVVRGAERSAPVTPTHFDGDLRALPEPQAWHPGDPVRMIPRRRYLKPGTVAPNYVPGPDPLLPLQLAVAQQATRTDFTTPTRNFAGLTNTGAGVPDPNGDVGPNHYIQVTNGGGTTVRIWDKAEPVPNVLTTFQLDDLAISGPCTSGFGDPVVLYDQFADRWLLTEFASTGSNLCVYVSQTGDPVSGGWYAYTFTTPTFPDYPKYAVWPTDANGGQGSYLVTSNDGGPGAYALDRGQMLVGNAATFQRLTLPNLPGFNFETATPADVDGPNPPDPMASAIIMRHRDTENHSGPAAPGDLLEMWDFDVDWVTTANTSLTQHDIDISEFDSDLCGLTSFSCFPQPGTGTTLDPLREVIMHRLTFIRFDTYDSLVGNFVTDLDGTNHGGIRWVELRRSGGGAWSLYQEGTFSLDSDHRWMGASAMDQSGNIALGYSVSSSSTFPSLRFTGRMVDDTLGVMTQAETELHAGTSSSATNRWGDYASMSLDPVDDCTFWFTSLDTNSSNSWRTQIASFRFEACGCQLEPSALVITAQDVGPNEIEIGWNDADLDTVVQYLVQRSTTPGGPYATVATVPDSSPGMTGGPGYFYSDTTVSGGTTYYYIVRASDGGPCKSPFSNEEGVTASGVCTLAPSFAGAQSAATPNLGTCTVDLSWSGAASNCGGGVDYSVYRSTTPGFTPGAANLIAENVIGSTFSDFDQLVYGTTYYYIVRARDVTIDAEDTNTNEVSAIPVGNVTILFSDDAGDTGTAQMVQNAPWFIEGTQGNQGPNVYKTGDYGDNTCAALTTPAVMLGVGSQLSFASRYDIENSWDKGEVQISVDGGSNWTRVPLSYPGTSVNTNDACGFPTGTYFTGTNNTWTTYTADLSAWNGMMAMIRFEMSSDTSVRGTGWWIDDIEISTTASCATGSACADNPFVDVGPDGPMLVCEFDIPQLTANTSSGNGPFEFQWTEDGMDIPGATGNTYQPSNPGTHTYNVRVRALTCPSSVSDGVDTELTTQGQPVFGGLVSATNVQGSTCSVDLDWNAGSTACPGPLRYFVYRDTTSPVSVQPTNLVAAGLPGTSFSDTSGLVNNTTYHYVVQAQDATTGAFDGNTIEDSATPDGPGSGLSSYYLEDFENAATFANWTVTIGPGLHTCGEWARSNDSAMRPSGGSGYFAVADNTCNELFARTSSTLTSPVIDLDLTDLNAVYLEYDIWFNWSSGNGNETGKVEVFDGSSWVTVWEDGEAVLNGHQSIDVTAQAAGNPNFRVRFDYQDAQQDLWYSVDNVEIITDRNVACSTFSGPASVPDGSFGTTPLHGDRTTIAGDVVDVTWDTTSCGAAADYNLIYGDLANVSSYTLGGSQCALGTSGSFTWNSVPPGDLFFLVVGDDGAGNESSWGFDGKGAERNGLNVSGECATVAKEAGNICP